MTKRANKKKPRPPRDKTSQATPPLDPMRRGMPAQDSITGVKEMTRGGKTFRIIKTDEIDEYELGPKGGKKSHRGSDR